MGVSMIWEFAGLFGFQPEGEDAGAGAAVDAARDRHAQCRAAPRQRGGRRHESADAGAWRHHSSAALVTRVTGSSVCDDYRNDVYYSLHEASEYKPAL